MTKDRLLDVSIEMLLKEVTPPLPRPKGFTAGAMREQTRPVKGPHKTTTFIVGIRAGHGKTQHAGEGGGKEHSLTAQNKGSRERERERGIGLGPTHSFPVLRNVERFGPRMPNTGWAETPGERVYPSLHSLNERKKERKRERETATPSARKPRPTTRGGAVHG